MSAERDTVSAPPARGSGFYRAINKLISDQEWPLGRQRLRLSFTQAKGTRSLFFPLVFLLFFPPQT